MMPPVGPRLPAHSQLRKLVAGGAERADMQAEGVITAGMASYAWHSLTSAPEGGWVATRLEQPLVSAELVVMTIGFMFGG